MAWGRAVLFLYKRLTNWSGRGLKRYVSKRTCESNVNIKCEVIWEELFVRFDIRCKKSETLKRTIGQPVIRLLLIFILEMH